MEEAYQIEPELSVVVLGYQAGERLKIFVGELVNSLAKERINYEIVLVANYWPERQDCSPAIASQLAKTNQRIRPVIEPKRGSMGWDMRSGFDTAQGSLIAVIDGDEQMPAADVVRVYKKIKEGAFDLVKTYREKRGDSFWRRIIHYFYNLFFKMMFPGLNCRDINSKPKIFTRDFFNKIKLTSDDWFIDAEIMLYARRLNIKIGEIPTVFLKNEKRPSFVRVSAIFEFIKNLIRARIYESFKLERYR